ncbi:hypothetical protein ALC57_01226 [Trachymyrmex cornetzi]|uniref:Uncharacterized protein n=1 Tax=Trachymyrmex cornetzi TaxID=471704 RepID=A0A151JQ22_9HYME|nr:hypothetical protein ALC57_01226 [Trachymyrmex cornetzi]
MIINPLNVVRLLLAPVSSIYLTKTPVTEAEIELKENIQKLLLDSIFHYNGLKVTEETYLNYQEPYKLHNSEIIEDDEEAWSEDNLNSHPQCSNDDADFDSSYKRRAVEYWRNWDINEKNKNKRNRPLKLVQNKFRRVRIISRKIMKSVTRRTIEDSVELQNTANGFLKTVKPFIEQFGSENVFNSDQSGFQLEIHSGRSLSNEGVKKVEYVVQSISSTIHSYTIQSILSCNGNLLLQKNILPDGTTMIILKGTTRKIQPLDVYGFCRNLIFDPMHDILCGIGPMILKLVLTCYVMELKFFNVENFNDRLVSFQYGFVERKNKPSANFNERILNQKGNTLNQKAMQIWCLLCSFPFLISDWVPKADEHLQKKSFFLLNENDLKSMGLRMGPMKEENFKIFLRLFFSGENGEITIPPDFPMVLETATEMEGPSSSNNAVSNIEESKIPKNCFSRFKTVHDTLLRHPQGADILKACIDGIFTEDDRRSLVRIVTSELVKVHGDNYYPPEEAKIALAENVVKEFPKLRDQTTNGHSFIFGAGPSMFAATVDCSACRSDDTFEPPNPPLSVPEAIDT